MSIDAVHQWTPCINGRREAGALAWVAHVMSTEFRSTSFVCPNAAAAPIDAVLREHFEGSSWAAVRKLVTSGKVLINGNYAASPRDVVLPGATVELRMTAPRRRSDAADDSLIEYVDADVVVVRKPAGLSSVRHDNEPTSLEEVLPEVLRRRGMRNVHRVEVVHRLDKVTSGLMLFALNDAARRHLKEQLRVRSVGRVYAAVVHGEIQNQTISLRLVRDRGDGVRGITTDPTLGNHATTHVKVLERVGRVTLVECRLETGRTHQIRIHLSAQGHPIVGDAVYGKGRDAVGRRAPRTLLHAQSIEFQHPKEDRRVRFEQGPPPDFVNYLATQRGSTGVQGKMPRR